MSSVGFNPYQALNSSPLKETAKPESPKPADAGDNAVSKGVSEFREALEAAEKAAVETAVSGADPHAMVEALANAEMVLDTAVTIRDKVVEAYQELLRMPV